MASECDWCLCRDRNPRHTDGTFGNAPSFACWTNSLSNDTSSCSAWISLQRVNWNGNYLDQRYIHGDLSLVKLKCTLCFWDSSYHLDNLWSTLLQMCCLNVLAFLSVYEARTEEDILSKERHFASRFSLLVLLGLSCMMKANDSATAGTIRSVDSNNCWTCVGVSDCKSCTKSVMMWEKAKEQLYL